MRKYLDDDGTESGKNKMKEGRRKREKDEKGVDVDRQQPNRLRKAGASCLLTLYIPYVKYATMVNCKLPAIHTTEFDLNLKCIISQLE